MKITNSVLAVGVTGMLAAGGSFNLPAPAVNTQAYTPTAVEASVDYSKTSLAGVNASINTIDLKTHQKVEAVKNEKEEDERIAEEERREAERLAAEEAEKEAAREALKLTIEAQTGISPAFNPDTKLDETEENLYWLSHLIYAEVGGPDCSDTLQLWTGSVILNRVASPRYPNNIKDVIFQTQPTLQYGCTRGGASADIFKEPNERAIKNAQFLLENGSIIPSNVFGQQNKVDAGWTHFGTINGVVFSSYGKTV